MAEESYPRLISLAVHELRTPASVVGGYLRMLQRDTDEPLGERQRKMVDEAEKSCARLVSLIAALSEVAKLDEGLIAMSMAETDLFPLVADAADSVHEAADRDVHLEVRGDTSGAIIRGDGQRLRSAFQAIFHAIVREQVGPGTVIVDRRTELDRDPSSAVIIVADASAVQAAYTAPVGMFDEKRGGVGLSLPLARRVIEAHRGRLWSPAARESLASSTFDRRAARATALIAIPLFGAER
jgi:signal transduction histidine kinase